MEAGQVPQMSILPGSAKAWPGNHKKSFTSFFFLCILLNLHTREATRQSLTGVFCRSGTIARSSMQYEIFIYTKPTHIFLHKKTLVSVKHIFYVHIFSSAGGETQMPGWREAKKEK